MLDPTAGSGGFLLEVLLQVWHNVDHTFHGQRPEHIHRIKTDFALTKVYGIEFTMSLLASVRLICCFTTMATPISKVTDHAWTRILLIHVLQLLEGASNGSWEIRRSETKYLKATKITLVSNALSSFSVAEAGTRSHRST